MQRYTPTDDYRQSLERARRRARIGEADANEAEWEALSDAAGSLVAPEDLHPAARRTVGDQLEELRARVDALDAGDLRFRQEADALWADVQDYAFRTGALTLPQRPLVQERYVPDASAATLRDLAVRRARIAGSGERRARLPGADTVRRFALHDVLDQPPARSMFHRGRQAQNLLTAGLLLSAEDEEAERAAPPVASQPAPVLNAPPKTTQPATGGVPTGAGSGSGAGGAGRRPTAGGTVVAPPVRQPTPAPAPARRDREAELEDEEAEAMHEDAEAREAAAEPVAELVPRALPDAPAAEVEDLVSAFSAAGLLTRGEIDAAAADRGLARERGDALRLAVGAGLGLDRPATFERLPSRQNLQAIARAARLDAPNGAETA